MIEKLDTQDVYSKIDFVTISAIAGKIDELIDAVNTIQKEREAERFEIQEWISILEAVRKSVNTHEKQIDKLQTKVKENVEPVDPYAEQRKWIGCLCRCWDSDITDDTWGILQDIKDNKTEKYYLYGIGYEHCEPVKPNNDIIYKGGDNE